jgi:hypothetical protein
MNLAIDERWVGKVWLAESELFLGCLVFRLADADR